MGCDYYICKCLVIEYLNDHIDTSIELERNTGYFYYPDIDEDDEDYDDIIEKYINEQLESKMKPIIIYKDNLFKTDQLENKYKVLIEDNIKNYGKNWKDIKRITKRERRFERF